MSTPVRTTWIQANAAAILARYYLTSDLDVRNKHTGYTLKCRVGGLMNIRGKDGKSSVSYNRLRWLLHSGELPDIKVDQLQDGSLRCGEEIIHKPTKQSQAQKAGKVAEQVNIPSATRIATDIELLQQYDELAAEFRHRGIDPVRRVRIITTEVPL